MKKLLLKSLVLLCALVVGSLNSWATKWVKTAPGDLATNDIVVIVDLASGRSLNNTSGTSNAPTAATINFNGDAKTEISSNFNVTAAIQWVVTKDANNFKFGVAGSSNYLYCTNTNNGVRVGTNTNNIFTFDQNFLKNAETSRYVGVYNSGTTHDWRCYTTIHANIEDTKIAFYKKVESTGEATTVTIDASGITNTDIAAGTAAGSFAAIVKDNSSTTISSAAVTWSSSKPAVATINQATGVVTLVKRGSTTITASYEGVDGTYQSSSNTYILNVTNSAANDGSAAHPFTPSEARDALDESEIDAETDYYVTGIIQSVSKLESDKSITYWISNEGTETNRLECYKGKGIGGTTFAAKEDLEVGDIVTVKGKLTTYNNTYEFNVGNEITAMTLRTKVNLATLSFSPTSLVVGSATTSQATATIDQPSCTTATYTYESLDADIATCTSTGVITPVAKGEARIKVTLSIPLNDQNYKPGTVKTKLENITIVNPSHIAQFSINGVINDSNNKVVEEGEAITFPTAPTAINSKSFVGWTTSAITGNQDSAPATLVTSANMGNADIIYYAVFANKSEDTQVTDHYLTITNKDFTDALTGSYETKTITKTIDETNYDIKVNGCEQNSMCQLRDNSTLSYIFVPTLPGNITNIATTDCMSPSTSSFTGTIHIKSTKTRGNSDTNDITKATLSSATSFSIDVTGEHKSFYLLTSAGLRIANLTVTYSAEGTITTYSAYCTTVVPDEPTTPDVDDVAHTVTLTTTANMAGWRTFAPVKANQNYTVDGTTKVYYASATADGKVTLAEIAGGVPANTPVILHQTSGGTTITLTETTTNITAPGSNLLQVSTASQDLGTVYRLGYKSAYGVGFYTYTTNSAPAGIVYLETVTAAHEYLSFDIDGETTAINNLTPSLSKGEGEYYDLQGRKVAQPTKGLYIVNGHKVIVK